MACNAEKLLVNRTKHATSLWATAVRVGRGGGEHFEMALSDAFISLHHTRASLEKQQQEKSLSDWLLPLPLVLRKRKCGTLPSGTALRA